MESYLVMGEGEVGATIAYSLQNLKKPHQWTGRTSHNASDFRFEGMTSQSNLCVRPITKTVFSSVGCMIFAVKAFDLVGAIDRYLPYLKKHIPIIVIAPGIFGDLLERLNRKHPEYIWRLGYPLFHTVTKSQGVFTQETRGPLVWGGLGKNFPPPSGIESELLKDRNSFLWDPTILFNIRKKWLFDLVMNSLCAGEDLNRLVLLLNDVKSLRQTFEEGYRLSSELWGHFDQTAESLFYDLVSFITSHGQKENPMYRSIRLGESTENMFYAKMALDRRHMEKLASLAHKIELKEPVKKTKDRRRYIP
jgi:ketopantoate reductase